MRQIFFFTLILLIMGSGCGSPSLPSITQTVPAVASTPTPIPAPTQVSITIPSTRTPIRTIMPSASVTVIPTYPVVASLTPLPTVALIVVGPFSCSSPLRNPGMVRFTLSNMLDFPVDFRVDGGTPIRINAREFGRNKYDPNFPKTCIDIRIGLQKWTASTPTGEQVSGEIGASDQEIRFCGSSGEGGITITNCLTGPGTGDSPPSAAPGPS